MSYRASLDDKPNPSAVLWPTHRSKWEPAQIQVHVKCNAGNSTPSEEGKVKSTFIHSEGEEGYDFTEAMTFQTLTQTPKHTDVTRTECQCPDLHVLSWVFKGVNIKTVHMAVQIHCSYWCMLTDGHALHRQTVLRTA